MAKTKLGAYANMRVASALISVSLALEYGQGSVTVYSLCPGGHRVSVTSGLSQLVSSPGTHLSTIPKGRINSWEAGAPVAQAGIELEPLESLLGMLTTTP